MQHAFALIYLILVSVLGFLFIYVAQFAVTALWSQFFVCIGAALLLSVAVPTLIQGLKLMHGNA